MTRELFLTNRAKRDLRRLAPDVQDRVLAALERYALTGEGDVRHLKGSANEWRLRIGVWRAIFRFSAPEEIIVDHIGHRSRVYRAREEGPAWGDREDVRVRDLRFDDDAVTVLAGSGRRA